MVNSICDYNHEIAEYAVASLSRPVSAAALVSMLIKTPNNVSATAVLPARNQPTLAPPRGSVRRLSHDEPVMQNPLQPIPSETPPVQNPLRGEPFRLDLPDGPAKRLTPIDPGASREPVGQFEIIASPSPNQARPNRENQAETAVIHNREIVPVQAQPQPHSAPDPKRQWKTPAEETPVEKTPAKRSVNKPPLGARGELKFPSGKNRPAGLYAGLANVSASDRASRLTNILHRDLPADNLPAANLPTDVGRRIELADYLALGNNLSLGNNRPLMIEAFWLARQRAAEYQALAQQARLLDELRFNSSPHPMAVRPTAARLAAMRLATDAEMVDAHIRLIQSQYRLTDLVGKTFESPWLLAATTPRSTPYDAVADMTTRTWETRRLRAVIPSMHDTLCRRATAVVEADTARAAATIGLQTTTAGQMPGAAENLVLDCTIRQTEETMSLLASLTDYNNAIARHATHR